MVIESQVARVGVSDSAGSPRRATARRVLTVGFVNNMPDAAFEDTYRQFAGLLGAGDHDFTIDLRGYCLPSVPRSDVSPEGRLSSPTRTWRVCTPILPTRSSSPGLEPRSAGPGRRAVLGRPGASPAMGRGDGSVDDPVVPGVACGRARPRRHRPRPLPAEAERCLRAGGGRRPPPGPGAGAGWSSVPHSRYNDIPASTLNARYRLLVASPLSGWSVATRQSEGRMLVLLQGHPEYGRLTLLKEYRRDVRRFLEGIYAGSPCHPAGLPRRSRDRAAGVAFRARCESRPVRSDR